MIVVNSFILNNPSNEWLFLNCSWFSRPHHIWLICLKSPSVFDWLFQRAENEKIKSLFQYIECYTAREVVMRAFRRPFIPDYILVVWRFWMRVKIRAIVALQIRDATMQYCHHPIDVTSIEGPQRNPQKVDAGIEANAWYWTTHGGRREI